MPIRNAPAIRFCRRPAARRLLASSRFRAAREARHHPRRPRKDQVRRRPAALAGRQVGRLHGQHDRRREGQARHRHLDGELGRRAEPPADVHARQRELAALEPGRPYLSFLASRGTEEEKKKGAQVWLLDRTGGEAQKLTDVDGGVGDYSWSPDSTRIVFTKSDKDPADDPEKMEGWKRKTTPPIVIDRYHFKQDREGYLKRFYPHIWVFDVAAKKAEQITTGPVRGQRRRSGRPTGRRSRSSACARRRSRPHRGLEYLRGRREGRRRAETADDVRRHRRRPAGVEPGRPVDCLHAGRRDEASRPTSSRSSPSSRRRAAQPKLLTAALDRAVHGPICVVGRWQVASSSR